jgi:outer membrane protein
MKKYNNILLICLLWLAPCMLSAQGVKFGHVSPEEIMEQMKGFDTAQKVMMDYQTELQTEGQEMVKEFQQKLEEYQGKSASYSAAVRKIKEEELVKMQSRIKEFSTVMEESLQKKKYDLLLPFQNKIIEAIQEVAKEEKYTYIFNKTVLASYVQGNDITDKVKKKLGIIN